MRIHACMSYYHRRLPHRMEALRTIHFQEGAAAGAAEDLRHFRQATKNPRVPQKPRGALQIKKRHITSAL